MPPKRRQPMSEDESYSGSEPEAKPKAAPKKRAPAKKGDDAKPAAPRVKVPKLTETRTLDSGWVLHPPSLIYKPAPGAQGGTKIAAMDLDGCLVHTKSGASFAVTADDWRWFNDQVPKKLAQWASEGYQLVIFSNQGGIQSALLGKAAEKTMARIDGVLSALRADAGDGGPHVQVFLATQKDDLRKPAGGMWRFFVEQCNAGVAPDKDQCFFVGDAAGRQGTDGTPGDFASSDREFAQALGIEFKLPEDVFGPGDAPEAGKETAGAQCSDPANDGLASVFDRLAARHARLGEHFPKRALEKVAGLIRSWPAAITSGKDLAKEKGVGKGSVNKIDEYLKTGTVSALGEEGEVAAQIVDKNRDTAVKFL